MSDLSVIGKRRSKTKTWLFSLLALGALCLGGAWLAQGQEIGLLGAPATGLVPVSESSVQSFADRLLDRPESVRSALNITAALISGSELEDADGAIAVHLEVAVQLDASFIEGRQLRLTLVAYDIDEEPLLLAETVTLGDVGNAAWWVYRRIARLPEDFLEAVVVVEDPATGRIGGARVGYGPPIAPPPAQTQRSGVAVDQQTTLPPTAVAPQAAAQSGPSVVRLVPPRGNEQTGKIRVRTIVTTDDVAKVRFMLDGRQVAEDSRSPFVFETDLGEQLATHEILAIALSAGDRELGRDRLLLNARLELFDVRVALESVAAGLAVTARVTVPRDAQLERLEFYRNEELLATQQQPPFQTSVPAADVGPSDYLRAVAYLADGSSLDDVRLMSEANAGERIEVNLVQVFAVASNRNGEPQTDLTIDDFTVTVGRRQVEIERFERAEDVPLSLGLVFDTSGSMYSLMPDAKQAGARFLSSILREGDRAFLIDFDSRPRLAHPLTADLGSLLRRFGQLTAQGNTALYDAVVFGTLQFDNAPGRRALVVLTDGVPSGGNFGARQSINQAIERAVPIYAIDLSGVLGGISAAKLPLVGLAKATGGRVHTIGGEAGLIGDYEAVSRELEAAYAQIERELRSQYILAFSTPEPLTADELKSIKVKVARPGTKVRRVVGTTTG